MGVTAAQKKSIEEVLHALTSATGRPPRKRELAGMFLELVDRDDWPEYYEVIPEPRCLNNIQTMLEKNRYKDALDAYTDLSLVFLNALFYNEPDSQIAKDAQTLKNILESEWKSRPLPTPRDSPPPMAPKVQKPAPPKAKPALPAAAAKAIAPAPPAPTASTSTMPPPVAPVEPPAPAEHSDSESEFSSDDDDLDDPHENPLGVQDLDIVRQLERGLPRYAPLVGPEGGWMADVKHERHLEIVQAIKAYRDEDNVKLSTALDGVPEDKLAISWRLLESRSRSKTYYPSSRPFDCDLARLFESGRRHYLSLVGGIPSLAGEGWTRVVALQPLVLAPPLRAPGPHVVESLAYKGLVLRARDYVHVVSGAEPESPTMGLGVGRPLVGRVVGCWRQEGEGAEGGEGEGGVSVRWYLHSNEIGHLMPETRRGEIEGEVVQTDKITHHLLPDIIERVAVQHPSVARRGRPRASAWFPSWPVYVCGCRYDAVRASVRRIPRAEWFADHPESSASADDLELFERPVSFGMPKEKPKAPPPRVGVGVGADRSVVGAGGQAVSAVEELGVETARHFERDPSTGAVLWFPGPPMHNVARVPPPRHRLEYLAFLARKYRPDLEPTPTPTAKEPSGAAGQIQKIKQNGNGDGEEKTKQNGNGEENITRNGNGNGHAADDSMGSDDTHARGLSMEVDPSISAGHGLEVIDADAGERPAGADVNMDMDGTELEPPAAKRRKVEIEVEERYISASERIRDVLARSGSVSVVPVPVPEVVN